MSTGHAAGRLIPWYVNGTLRVEERRELEGHLTQCTECRRLADEASEIREILGRVPLARLEEHPQAQLLGELAEESGGLDDEVVAWVRAHVADCATCADALETYRALLAGEPSHPPLASRLLAFLERTVLRPAPALAYLVVAAMLAYPAFRGLRGTGRDGESGIPAELPVVIAVPGEPLYRDAASPQPPLEVPRTAGTVLLALRLDIDRADLADSAAAFRVELRDGETPVWSEVRSGGAFDESGALLCTLHPRRLAPRGALTLAVVYEKPGDPMDQRVMFRRAIRLIDKEAP